MTRVERDRVQAFREATRRVYRDLADNSIDDQTWRAVLRDLAEMMCVRRVEVYMRVGESNVVLTSEELLHSRVDSVKVGVVDADVAPLEHVLEVVGSDSAFLRLYGTDDGVASIMDSGVLASLEHALSAYLAFLPYVRTLDHLRCEADCVPFARFLVDESLRLHHANRLGRTHAASGGLLLILDDQLSTHRSKDLSKLQEVIEACKESPAFTATVSRFGSSASQRYVVRVRRVRSAPGHWSARSNLFEIVVLDRRRRAVAIDPIVTHGFELTRTEHRVLIELLTGRSTAELAALFGITAGTAKQHVLRIMRKMDVQRQMMLALGMMGPLVCTLPEDGSKELLDMSESNSAGDSVTGGNAQAALCADARSR